MATARSKAFTPVSLSAYQATRLENVMKQQVQDAVLARSVQVAKDNELDSDWRFVSSHGQLKTFKLRDSDPFSSTSSWATTLEKTTRSTACHLNERIGTGGQHSQSSWTSYRTRQTVSGVRPPQSLQSFRTFGRVQGNYRDIVGVHYTANSADFVQQQKLLNPAVIDGAVLRTIRATKDSYLGIKWLAESSFPGKRDVCFVEMVGYTTDNRGQEVGFAVSASVDVPECPELTSLKLTRVRMKRTMLVIPTVDDPKATSEVFVMGTSESSVANSQYRMNMATLDNISQTIDSQNIIRERLTHRKDWIPDGSRPSCTICSRRFRFISRRRHHCRMCGDVMCKTCYVNRSVPLEAKSCDALALCRSKFCLRCVMGLRAVDKTLDKFSPQVSKMLSLDIDMSVTETLEEFLELDSPDSNPRASSFFTFYKNPQEQLHTRRTDVEFAWNTTADRVKPQVAVTSGGIGALVPYGSGKLRRTSSISINPAHSKSFTRLRGLSTASLDSQLA
ncbi:hypothetical protein V7S43_008774 [Phytophthora oleae]|uniref:FYVE-type domain-containing protein n=1 Tax=Phytophthora oleae TaxID=2107226 RepID=A0ABD3FHS3_9STRA